MDEWVEVKVVLMFAYSNQKVFKVKKHDSKQGLCTLVFIFVLTFLDFNCWRSILQDLDLFVPKNNIFALMMVHNASGNQLFLDWWSTGKIISNKKCNCSIIVGIFGYLWGLGANAREEHKSMQKFDNYIQNQCYAMTLKIKLALIHNMFIIDSKTIGLVCHFRGPRIKPHQRNIK